MGLFRRSRPAAEPTGSVPTPDGTSGAVAPAGAAEPSGPAVDPSPPAWQTLPPLTPTVTSPASTFKIGAAVKEDLVALDSPRLTLGMGHLVGDDGPPGVVSGLATVGVQRQAATDATPVPRPSDNGGGLPALDLPMAVPPGGNGNGDAADHADGVASGVLVPRIVAATTTPATPAVRPTEAPAIAAPMRHLPLVAPPSGHGPSVQRQHAGSPTPTAAPPGPDPASAAATAGTDTGPDVAGPVADPGDVPAPDPAPTSDLAAGPDTGPASETPGDRLDRLDRVDAEGPVGADAAPSSVDVAVPTAPDPIAAPPTRPRRGALGPPIEVGPGAGGDAALPLVQRSVDSGTPAPRAATPSPTPGPASLASAAAAGHPPVEMPIIQRLPRGERSGVDSARSLPVTVARTPGDASPTGATPLGAGTAVPAASTPSLPPDAGADLAGTPAGGNHTSGPMPLVQRQATDGHDGHVVDGVDRHHAQDAGAPSSAEAAHEPAADASTEGASAVSGSDAPDGAGAGPTVRPTLGVDDQAAPGKRAPDTASGAPDAGTGVPAGPAAPGLTAADAPVGLGTSSAVGGGATAASGLGPLAMPLPSLQRQAADDVLASTDDMTTVLTSGSSSALGAAAAAATATPDTGTASSSASTSPGPFASPAAAGVTVARRLDRSGQGAAPGGSLPLVAQRSLAAAPSLASALATRTPGRGPTTPAPAPPAVTVPVPTWPAPNGSAPAPVVQRWPDLSSVRDAGSSALADATGGARDRIEDLAGQGRDAATDRLSDAASGLPAVPDSLPSLDLPDVPRLPAPPEVPGLPSLPGLPGVPTLPTMAAMPTMPGMPAVPGMPDLAGLAGGAVPMAEMTFPAPGSPGAAGGAATPGPAGSGGGAGAAGAGGAGGAAGGDLDELANKLYDRIRWRMRSELRLDRERAGLGAGVRH